MLLSSPMGTYNRTVTLTIILIIKLLIMKNEMNTLVQFRQGLPVHVGRLNPTVAAESSVTIIVALRHIFGSREIIIQAAERVQDLASQQNINGRKKMVLVH